MKLSVVSTVLNESKTISTLLDSLVSQTLLPHEIIIVDGGSSDETGKIIEKYSKKYPFIHLIVETGNISHGRNVGIREAKSEIIALIDAGCIAEHHWLSRLAAPFKEKDVGLVAGFYDMTTTNAFSEAVAPFHGVTERKFDERTFMPSARSMALRRETWETVGGFNEEMFRAGEDTLFNYEVLKNKIKVVRVPEARVKWMVPDTISETCKKFFSYAKGDAEANIWWHPAQKLRTHNIKILTIFARYFVFFSLFSLGLSAPLFLCFFIYAFVTYLFWTIWKMRHDVSNLEARLYVPVVQVISDISVMAGFVSGLLRKSSSGRL